MVFFLIFQDEWSVYFKMNKGKFEREFFDYLERVYGGIAREEIFGKRQEENHDGTPSRKGDKDLS